MKTIHINLPIDYIEGYITRGHYEGEVEMNEDEINEFKNLLQKKVISGEYLSAEEQEKLDSYKEDILTSCEIVVDDFEIEDSGDIQWQDLF